MTRPDAADGSDEPAPGPDAPEHDGGAATEVLVLAGAALAAIATRTAADADRLGEDVLAGEADATSAVAVRLRRELAEQGVELDAAAAPVAPALSDYAAAHPGRDVVEVLVGVRLARGLVADLGAALGGEAVSARLAGVDDPLGEPAARVVTDAAADRRTHDRLAPLARRMLGEALVLVDVLLAALPAAAAAADAADGGRRALVKRVKSAHGRRVAALGL